MCERVLLASLIYSLETSSIDGAFAPQEIFDGYSQRTATKFSVLPKTSLAATENNRSTINSNNPPVFSGFGHAAGDPSSAIKNQETAYFPAFSGFEHAAKDSVQAAANPTAIETPKYQERTIEDKNNDPSSINVLQESLSKKDELADYVATAKRKVLLIREDLDSKEREYQAMVTGLNRDLQDQAETYENQHKSISFQFENFKTIDAQEKSALHEEMKAREENLEKMAQEQEAILADEVEVLEQMLDLANCEVALANNLTAAVGDQHEELVSQMEELKERYINDSMDLEDKLEMEQNSRQKERRMIDRSIEDLKDEHARQLRLIRSEAQVMTESVRSGMTNEIFLKEMEIQKAALKLKSATPSKENLVKRATQLELDRSNLPSLGRQGVKVAKKKARSGWQRAKNFFKSDRIA